MRPLTDVGHVIERISKMKSHPTAEQAAAAGYSAEWHLGNQRADLIVTNRLASFKDEFDAFSGQHAEAAKKVKDYIQAASNGLQIASSLAGMARAPTRSKVSYRSQLVHVPRWSSRLRAWPCVVCGVWHR